MWMHKENGSELRRGAGRGRVLGHRRRDLHLPRQLPAARPHVPRHHAVQRQRHRVHDLGRPARTTTCTSTGSTSDYLADRQPRRQLLAGRAPRGAGAVQARQHLLPAHVRRHRLEPEPGEVRHRVEHLRPVDRAGPTSATARRSARSRRSCCRSRARRPPATCTSVTAGPGAWGGPVNDSQYVWLPIAFPSATSMSMSWYPQITIDAATGTVTGGATRPTTGSPTATAAR